MTESKSGERPQLSALIPCLNEAENVAAIATAVAAEFTASNVTYEIVFIDNGSTDRTVNIIKELCVADERIRLIANTRNFGQMRSPTYGIYQATSTGAVIGISADFQDPPELIKEFIARWRNGALIVLGVRQSERTTMLMRAVRAMSYGFLSRFADYKVIPGATGFGLYDRRVVDCLRSWKDPEPFFRGMLVESGFSIELVPYHRPGRAAGISKNNFYTLFKFALSSLASSSKNLLKAPIYMAAVVFLTTLVASIGAVVAILIGHAPWLWLTAAAIQAGFAFVFLFLGLIGEQIRLISQISRDVPLVIEKERVNFPCSE